MARNGSGTMTIPNTMTSQTPVTASAHNQNYSDIGTELTNSVAADGQTTMTGPLKASNGSVTNPSMTFGSDQNTGAYRIGADNYGIAVGGSKVVDVASTGVTVTGNTDTSGGVVKQNGFALQPIGLGPLQWTGRTAPPGWVLTGQTYNRADYLELWDFAETEIANGNTFYTNGNGTTTFTVGTMEGYVPAGTDSGGARIASFTDVGDTAGASARTLETANLPPYTPSGTVMGVSVTSKSSVVQVSSGLTFSANLAGGATDYAQKNNGQITSTGTGSFNGAAQGGTSTGFGIVQLSGAFNFIVFAGA